ncbi:hypothetical protein LAZ67_7000528, partial [Cordylochernes scorpioides]
MEDPLKDCTTLEQRAVIRFLNAEGIQTSQICQRMKNIYGESCLSQKNNYKWVNKFKNGRITLRGKLSKGVLFLHDNARLHTSCKTVSTIIKLGFEVLEHPAYSPDLAPSDYFLFGLLKKELKGKRFDPDEDVQKVVQDFFHTLGKSAYKEGIYKLPERWRRCIESQAGDLSKSLYSYAQVRSASVSMELPLVNVSTCELRSVIRFFFTAKNETTVNIHRNLVSVYGEGCMSIQMVRRWRSWFLEGRQNVHDDERSDRPVTATDNAAVAAVRNVVEANRRVTIDEIMIRLPPGIEIECSSIGTIIATDACHYGRSTTVTLRCSPGEDGAGRITLPQMCTDGTCDGCNFHFLWLTRHACRQCSPTDYQ